MFKLAITALLTVANATSAAADKAAVKKDATEAEAGALKYKVTPGSPIWNKSHVFMADTTAKAGATLTAAKLLVPGTDKIESYGTDCQKCVLSGNTYVAGAAKCDAKTGKATADAKLDLTLTYDEYLDGMKTCTAATTCAADSFVVADFTKEVATDKKAGYTWDYGWKSEAKAWDSCFYTATMPTKGFKGGLLLSHVLTDDTQAVVRVINSKDGKGYLYNSFTLKKLSVGTTHDVVVPFADSIDISMTAMDAQTAPSKFKITFKRETNEHLALFTLEHGGVIVWVIIGIVVFCLLCVGVIVWKKCFHKSDDFYVEDSYARV